MKEETLQSISFYEGAYELRKEFFFHFSLKTDRAAAYVLQLHFRRALFHIAGMIQSLYSKGDSHESPFLFPVYILVFRTIQSATIS